MKDVSKETREKLDRLFHGGSFWNRVLASSEEQVALLQDIGFSGEAGAIPEIAFLLVDASGAVWRAAAEAAHRLLQTLSAFDLVNVDQRMRAIRASGRGLDHKWQKLRPSDLRRFASSDFAASVLGLASFHHDGYVREAAVNSLASLNDGQELPFLLLRLNDWVPPVRDSAALAVNARLRPEYARHFLHNLRLVLRLERCGRANRNLVDIVSGLLRRAECREVLQAAMKSGDRALRRASFQLAAEAEQSARTAIIKTALADSDPVARAWAARRFLPEVTPEELPSVASALLADCFMPVRRDALWALGTKCPDFAVEPLRGALLDSHVGMREVARHFLAKDGFDARQFYLDALECRKSETLASAIRGVGETGKAEDAKLMSSFLNAPEPRIRRAATYSIGKLDAEHFLPQLTRALTDETPGVSREAKKALLPKARQQSLDEYWNLFRSDDRCFVRRNALTLMLRFGKWEKLPPLLIACADEDKRLAGLAQNRLQAWFRSYNSSFAEPTKTDFERIRDALTRATTFLPSRAVAEIRDCLKIYFKSV